MSERKITVTLKGGEQYDAPWIVFGGDTIQEIEYDLDQFRASGLLTKIVAQAAELKNAHLAQRRSGSPYPDAPTQVETTVPPQYQQQHQGQQYQSGQTQQTQYGASTPTPVDPWATPPQGYGQSGGSAQQQSHPFFANASRGGAPTCTCGQAMEHKTTGGGRNVWRCPSWRWRDGNPTPDHDQIWVGDQ